MEALANQMHGLEDEARLTIQHSLPSLNAVSSSGSGLSTPTTTSAELTSSVPKMTQIPPREQVSSAEKELSAEPDGASAEEEDDEDKFFDAPEISAGEWTKPDMPSLPFAQKTIENFEVGHKRNISTASVNDTSFMKPTSDTDADVKEKLPQVSSDRRMAVSLTPLITP